MLVAFVLLVVAALGPGVTSASAHAVLRSSQPAQDARLGATHPTKVVLVFSEDVQARRGSVQVFGPDAGRVDHDAPTVVGNTVTQPMRPRAGGTYGISYTIVSADGHVVSGSLRFSIGTPSSGGGAGERASERASEADATTDWVYGVARGLLMLALLALAGGGIFSAAIVPDWRPRGLPAWLVLLDVSAAVSFVCVSVQADRGKLLDGTSTAALRAGLHTPFGTAMVVLVVAGVVSGPAVVALLRSTSQPTVAMRTAITVCFAALAACLSLSGHAHADGWNLRLVLDMVHVVAAAVWVGGLVQLWSMTDEARTRVHDVDRFSTVAFGAFLLLLATGLYAAWHELGTTGELLHSQYGRSVLAKLVLFACTVPLAALNRTTLVPGLRARPEHASSLLRQYVGRELGLLLVVIGVTAWLVQTPHPS